MTPTQHWYVRIALILLALLLWEWGIRSLFYPPCPTVASTSSTHKESRKETLAITPRDTVYVSRLVPYSRPQRAADVVGERVDIVADSCPDPYVDSVSIRHGKHRVDVTYHFPQRWVGYTWYSPDDTLSHRIDSATSDSTHTVVSVPDPRPWGIGVYGGYGISIDGIARPSVGIAISYSLFRW